MKPHIIALDVDGTIVDYDDRMTDRVRSTIQAAELAGHHVVIATGRSAGGALEVANRLGQRDGYLIASNGSVVVRLTPEAERGWEVCHVETFDPGPMLRRMREHLPMALFMVEDAELMRWASGEFPVGELASNEQLEIVSFDALMDKAATRIVMRELNGSNEDFLSAVERIGLHGVTYSVGWSNWLDIAPDGVSKASGVEYVCRQLGIAQSETVCAGDGMNDMEMMQWAGYGIAMGQAKDELKARADTVTGTVEEDGLATALEEYFGLHS